MKFISKAITFICITVMAITCLTARLFAQVQAPNPTSLVQDISIKIDNLGNAKWEATTKMTQAQWETFKSGPLANDPSITKRNMERSMSAYVIEDFSRDIDDMNRTLTIKLTVKAAALYDGNGNWEFKLFSKNAEVTKLADNAYMATSNLMSGNALVQQIYKVYFPARASNIQQQNDSFGNPLFTYSDGGGILSLFTWNNILGLILIIGAVFLFLRQKPQALSFLSNDKRIANT